MTPVDSKAVSAFWYDHSEKTLHVQFHSGHTYTYAGFPPEEFEAMLVAESKGQHFAQHVRPRYLMVKTSRPVLDAAQGTKSF